MLKKFVDDTINTGPCLDLYNLDYWNDWVAPVLGIVKED